MKFRAIAAILAVYASVVTAQVTLYIPGTDPEPITADVEGVDDQGRTTWRLAPGVASGTFTEVPTDVGTATLVAGPTEAHLVHEFASADCGINNGVALCTVVASLEDVGLITVTTEEPATGFVVQAAQTGAPSESGNSLEPTPSGSNPTMPTGTPTPTGTEDDNGAGKAMSSISSAVGVAALLCAFFL